MQSLVSIIIPCYNQSKFLDETLSSVLNQTYTNWECLIINDDSPDNTEEVAQRWVRKDSRFKYFFKENGGVSSARNFGLSKSNGEYIQFLDADDIIRKNKIELSLDIIESDKNENIHIVFTNFRQFINNIDKTLDPYCVLNKTSFTYENLLYKWNEGFSIHVHIALIKKEILNDVFFPEHMTAQEDWIFWVNVFKKSPHIFFLDEPLALYRRNSFGRTSKDMLEDNLKAYEYFKNFLNEDEFHKMSIVLISRYYKKSSFFVTKYNATKESNTYKVGNVIKKSLRKLYLLNFAKSILRIIKF